MPRTIVDIPESQLRDLDARCEMLKISRAEGVRRATEQYLRESVADASRGFGIWRAAFATTARARWQRQT